MSEKQKNADKGKGSMVLEVMLPQGITAQLKEGILAIKGPKGEAAHSIEERKLHLSIQGNKITISGKRATQRDKMMIGSVEAHIKNLIRGVQEPYKYALKVCSGHFPITVTISGDKLTVKNFFGEKVPRILHLKKGAVVKVEGDNITVESATKEIAGQISADIEQLVRRPGFDTRIFQDGIYITSKHGKEIK